MFPVKKEVGGYPLCSLDAAGNGALFKPLQLNCGGRVGSLGLIFPPLFKLLIFPKFSKTIFLEGGGLVTCPLRPLVNSALDG